MGKRKYEVNFDALDGIYSALSKQATELQEILGSVSGCINSIAASTNMSGNGADSIRVYMQNVHGVILGLLSELISLHCGNFLLYKQDYGESVDNRYGAVIHEAELDEIEVDFITRRKIIEEINDATRAALKAISGIVYIPYSGADNVLDAHTDMQAFLTGIDESVYSLENRHFSSDFAASEELLASLQAFVSERQSKSRTFKTGFSMDNLSNSKAYRSMYQAHLAVASELDAKAEAIDTAINNENQRIAIAEQAERAERERRAKIFNWVVTGVCIVGSVAVIAATGGAAAPLLVGAVSGVSGAITSGAKNLSQQYVETGKTSDFDWGSCGKDAVVGGITGFVTGAVGAGVGGAITNGLGSTAIGSSLLNSSNAVVRIGTGAVIGSVSETASGVVSRGASTLITSGGDLDAALDSAFDGKQIIYDAAIGGVLGGVKAAQDPPVGKKLTVDDLDNDELMDTKPKYARDPQKWLDDDGKIYVDGNGTWTYEYKDGTHVVYSDELPDFNRAKLVEAEYDTEGFNTTNHSADIQKAQRSTGLGGKGSGTTWHHYQDGRTLQLVPSKYHDIFTHRGGFSIAKGG